MIEMRLYIHNVKIKMWISVAILNTLFFDRITQNVIFVVESDDSRSVCIGYLL